MELPFHLVIREHVLVLVWPDGACRPASSVEVMLYKVLQAYEAFMVKLKLPTTDFLDQVDDDKLSGVRPYSFDGVRIRDIRQLLTALRAARLVP